MRTSHAQRIETGPSDPIHSTPSFCSARFDPADSHVCYAAVSFRCITLVNWGCIQPADSWLRTACLCFRNDRICFTSCRCSLALPLSITPFIRSLSFSTTSISSASQRQHDSQEAHPRHPASSTTPALALHELPISLKAVIDHYTRASCVAYDLVIEQNRPRPSLFSDDLLSAKLNSRSRTSLRPSCNPTSPAVHDPSTGANLTSNLDLVPELPHRKSLTLRYSCLAVNFKHNRSVSRHPAIIRT